MKKRPFIRQKVIHCGKQNRKTEYIEVDIFPYTETDRRKRKRKEVLSPPKQQNLNDKNARRYLVQLIKSNFAQDDIHLVLTYQTDTEPEDIEKAEHQVQLFIRRLKTRYKKAGLKLQYIFITEQGSRKGKIHHHVLLKQGIARDEIEKCWKLGFANARRIQENENGIEQLANYLQKETAGKKRWKSSQGLTRPWVTTSDDKYSRKTIDKMANLPPDCEEVKRFWERKFPEYILYECQNHFNHETARWSIYLKMRLRR